MMRTSRRHLLHTWASCPGHRVSWPGRELCIAVAFSRFEALLTIVFRALNSHPKAVRDDHDAADKSMTTMGCICCFDGQ